MHRSHHRHTITPASAYQEKEQEKTKRKNEPTFMKPPFPIQVTKTQHRVHAQRLETLAIADP